ncbi:sensor histidine kinase [Geomesophilobacter sediminis]|uniref:histidine kinase n=1 Tax=Geomesophilobacter sediminis TaxID=2798584 RepID=A0A8J7M1A6_9BACT|nr:ATP-binding protein [Geomesophilobacter sediminis]MBJ6726833.1 HAMP domain-containing protein [Geomesophilobacter sediminis]
MKIKQRQQINIIVLVVSILVIGSVFVGASLRLKRALEASDVADAILGASFERLMLRTDLHRSGSERSKIQLLAKHKQIGLLLQRALKEFPDAEDQKTIRELISLQDSIGHLSKTLRIAQEQQRQAASVDPFKQEVQDRLLIQLNTRIYETIQLDNKLQRSGARLLTSSLLLAGGGILLVLIVVSAVTIANSVWVTRSFGKRITMLRDGAVTIGGGDLAHQIPTEGDDEFSEVAVAFNEMGARLGILYRDLTRQIEERKKTELALRQAHDELEQRVADRTAELREKDRLLLVQSRQAAMGEMIGNIAHQWRQPLNSLGITIQQLLLCYDFGNFDRAFLERNVNTSMDLIQHMSATIDDFRNYFKADKERTEFKLSDAVAKTLSLVGESFRHQGIGVEVREQGDPVVSGFANEYAQVLLNILNNARDAFGERQTREPKITISIRAEGSRSVVTISDNAGGISEEIIDKIFDPYFSTKGPQYGTGVGLFMAKGIIENNMGGTLTARNSGDGAEFRIEV